MPVIKTYRHTGLKELLETGRSRKVSQDLQKRTKARLDALDATKTLPELQRPEYNLHPLHGHQPQRYAIKVSGPWRITFEFEGGDAYRVDLEQYH